MAESGDLRRHARVTMDCSGASALEGSVPEPKCSSTARTVDISEAGLRIKVPVPIEKGVYVGFNASKVRCKARPRCGAANARGSSYLVGLEFSGNLRWKPKTGAGPGNK